jgi:AcrR family transcriptional regulator
MVIDGVHTETAIAAARDVFWAQGYADTPVEDVVRATGYNRYKLYNAFGDKLGIFLAVLDNYYQERKSVFLSALGDPDIEPLDAIRMVYEFAITEMAARKTGCLICNVAADLGSHHPEVYERISSYLEEIGRAYEEALEKAKAKGQLTPSLDPKEGSAILLTLKLGLGTKAKHGATKEQLMTTFNAALALFEKH